MNPENIGEQIRMRHSSLWRQPLLYEKSVPKASTCHSQLNECNWICIKWARQGSAGEWETTPSPHIPTSAPSDPSPARRIPNNSRRSSKKARNHPIHQDLWFDPWSKMLISSTTQKHSSRECRNSKEWTCSLEKIYKKWSFQGLASTPTFTMTTMNEWPTLASAGTSWEGFIPSDVQF